MNQDANSQGVPTAQPVGPQKTSTLAIVAFALSLIPCINIIGLILGIVALVKLSDPKSSYLQLL